MKYRKLFWKYRYWPFTIIVFPLAPGIMEILKPETFDINRLYIHLIPLFFAALLAMIWLLFVMSNEVKHLKGVDIHKLEREKQDLHRKLEKPVNTKGERRFYNRFEQLKFHGRGEGHKIVFGHINYDPFFRLKYDRSLGEPSGIGYAVIKEIFEGVGIKIKHELESSTWENIFKRLTQKKPEYDVIATPLYETRTRLYADNISYCIPLFYSEVGLYVHENDFHEHFKSEEMSLRNFKKHSENNKGMWRSPFIDGEISKTIATKLKIMCPTDGEVVDITGIECFRSLLLKVNERNISKEAFKFNIVAMEIFKANSIIQSHNKNEPDEPPLKLVNILKSKELLFPVSFVVRKEDTVLRNFINLRIAEIRDRKYGSNNLIEIIKKEAYITDNGIKHHHVDNCLIQKYDFTNLTAYEQF